MQGFRLLLLMSTMVISLTVCSQDRTVYGARSAGMGNASVATSDLWSVFSNQAGLTSLNSIGIGMTFENKFAIKEMSTVGLGVAVPINNVGVVAFSCSRFGYSMFSQTFAGIAVSRKFFNSLSVGLQIDYINFHIGNNYGNRNLVTFETGLQYDCKGKLIIGLHLYNPIRIKIDHSSGERLAGYYRFGLAYLPISKIIIAAEIEKSTHNIPANIKIGAEYKVIKEFAFRLGIETYKTIYSFGASTYFYNFGIDISANYHQVLGLTSQISIAYHFNRSK